uniref:Gamma-glutamyltransferase 5 n=1 Tax=Salarias fasciatus TaxID=181472 RepID=A0A672G6I3_SALFA
MAKAKALLVGCLVLVGIACTVALVALCIAALADGSCSSGGFRHAAVSADSPTCSEIGRNMLQRGGSAVDGAIAALLCTSVVNPQSMGIGGGSIVTVRNKTGGVQVFNFRETVPKSFKPNLLNDCPTKFTLSTGAQWIGVPGELLGYEELHKQYGKLPWAKLFEPTIQLAREGMPIEILCNKNKTILGKGDILKFPKLAETMETIAQKGTDAFYNGKIGQDLIQDIRAAGGTLKMEDLRSFRVRVQDMHIPPPPAGGALLAFILKIMKGFPLTPDSLAGDKKIQMYHRYIEAAKFANGQKKYVRDPGYNREKSADHLLDPSFINRIREMISSNRTFDNSYYDNVSPVSDHIGTTHVSVLDEDGLAVSATSTINQLFGGAVYSPRTGIILNNELADFCGRADTLRAGEQPPSSMSPVILESKSGRILVIGGSGGSLITTSVALSLINHLWLGMDLKDAIKARIVFVDSQNNVNFEPGFDEGVARGLGALGHSVGRWKYFLNVVNAVEKDNGCIRAVSDCRKMGGSAGY